MNETLQSLLDRIDAGEFDDDLALIRRHTGRRQQTPEYIAKWRALLDRPPPPIARQWTEGTAVYTVYERVEQEPPA